ncbi:MAG: TIR domain-containing protein [Methylococcaceae bacterium]
MLGHDSATIATCNTDIDFLAVISTDSCTKQMPLLPISGYIYFFILSLLGEIGCNSKLTSVKFPISLNGQTGLMTTEIQYDVFLSHNSGDKPEVELLAKRLKEEAGLKPFLDKWQLIPGKPWQLELENAIDRSATAALFFGPHGEGPWHNEEIQMLLDKAARARDNFRAIPVLLPGANAEAINRFLKQRTWVDFRSGLDDDDAFQRLVAGIKGEVVESPGYELPDEPAPYRGLEPFNAEQKDYFFGRDEDILELVDRLTCQRFIAVIGASGSGKSSLVRAGLHTDVATKRLPDIRGWEVITVFPGSNPFRSLSEQLAIVASPTDLIQWVDNQTQRLESQNDGLSTAISALFAGSIQPILVVIDQFEEVFTHCKDQPDQQGRCRFQTERFIANLVDAIQSPEGRIRVVITLRADFVDRCLGFPRLRKLLESNQLLLGDLNEEALREAVVFPAKRVGAFFEKGLVEQILQDVANQPGSLPLLQHALKELWQARRGPWLTLDAYQKSGGVSGALQRRAQLTYEYKLKNDQQRAIARTIFLRLTTLGEGVGDTRRRASREELYPHDVSRNAVDEVIDALSHKDARLIVVNYDNTVEVTHETLIQKWSTLQEWLQTNRDNLRIHRRLTDTAKDWAENNDDPSYFYRGARLDDALELVESAHIELNKLERRFLDASRQKRDQEQLEIKLREDREKEMLRRTQLRLADSLVSQGQVMSQQQRWGKAKKLFCESHVIYKALEVSSLPAAAGYMWAAVNSPDSLMTYQGHEHAVTCCDLSTNCQRAISGSADGEVKMWDVATGRQLIQVKGHSSRLVAVRFLSDQSCAISASSDGLILIWDVATGQRLKSFGPKGKELRSMVVFPDGDNILYAYQQPNPPAIEVDGKVADKTVSTLELFNIAKEEEPLQFDYPGMVYALAIDPSGDRILIGSYDRTTYLSLKPLKIIGDLSGSYDIPGHQLLQWWAVQTVDFFPSGKHAIVGCNDHTLECWDLTKRQQIFSQKISGISSVATTSYGAVMVGCSDGTLRKIEESGQTKFFYGHADAISSIVVSRDGQWVLTGSYDHTLRLWHNGNNVPDQFKLSGFGLAPRVDFSSDGRLLSSFEVIGEEVKIWDVPFGEILTELPVSHQVNQSCFSTTYGQMFTAGEDGLIRLWDFMSGKLLRQYNAHRSPITAMAVAADVPFFVSGDEAGRVIIWDTDTGKIKRKLPKQSAAILHTVISDTGDLLVMATSAAELIVWEIDSKQPRWKKAVIDIGSIETIALSHDGTVLATGGTATKAILWNITNGERLSELKGHQDTVTGIAFSLDMQFVVTGSADGTIRIWTVDGNEMITFAHMSGNPPRTMPVTSLALSTGSVIASGMMGDQDFFGDVDIIVWDCSRIDDYLNWEKVLDKIRTTLTVNPTDANALRDLGSWYAFKGHWQLAAHFLDQARNAGANGTTETLTKCRLKIGDLQTAVDGLQRLVDTTTKEVDQRLQRFRIQCLKKSPSRFLEAARQGHTGVLRFMIDQGANLNGPAMKEAASAGKVEAVELLLSAGAPIDSAGEESPLAAAVHNGKVDVAELLIRHRAKVEQRFSNGESLLHRAAFQGNLEMIRLLLAHGHARNLGDKEGKTPLDYARQGAKVFNEKGESHWQKIYAVLCSTL